MATDLIRYDLLVQDALRGVVRTVLADAAKNGLQGDHHFFITFRTNAQGLRLSDRMRERYPEEMTIILQHQFWDLAVTEHAFEVGLSFSNKPERLLIPFAAVSSFHDPSVQFGLKFDLPEAAATPEAETETVKALPTKRTLAAVDSEPGKGGDNKPAEFKPADKPRPVLARVPTETADKDDDKAQDKGQDGEAPKVVSIDAFRKKP